MTVRNINLCSYISNRHLYAYLRLLIEVVQYLVTQIVFSATQLLVSITYISDYFISAQMFLPVHKSIIVSKAHCNAHDNIIITSYYCLCPLNGG